MTIQNIHDKSTACGKKGGTSRYRFITLVALMAAHDTLSGRQHNMKLCYVLRWFLYTQTPGSNFFCIPTTAGSMPHGAQGLYLFDGYADGADKPIPAIDISGYARRQKLHPAEIVQGRSQSRSHVPYFAHQMLLNLKNKPVDGIECSEESHLAHFGL